MLPPAGFLAATLLLAGCVPSQAIVTPAPEPTSTPIFASDEDALAAATEAYAKYLAVSDEITANGGANAELASSLVTPEQYQKELSSIQEFVDGKLRTQGESIANVVGLQSYAHQIDGKDSIIVYVCVDVSGVVILDESHQDVTPAGRQNIYPLEVEFEASPKQPTELIISRSETWSGTNFCR